MQPNFRVPVQAYLKKYIIKRFFAGSKGPYKIEEKPLLGKLFMSCIIDGRKQDCIDTHLEKNTFIEVILSQDMLDRSPQPKKLQSIAFFIDKMFKESMIDFILTAQIYGVRPFNSVKDFLQEYGIEEHEYSSEAAYKLWLRWKNKDHEKNVRQKRTKLPSVSSVSLLSTNIGSVRPNA
jgi:hypothetical protein